MAEPQFDFPHPELYQLSIRLSTDGFSFSAFCPTVEHSFRHHVYRVRRNVSMAANVKEMLAQSEALKRPYKDVRVILAQPGCLPVPAELYDESLAEELYAHSFSNSLKGCRLLHDALPNLHLVILYAVNKAVHQMLVDQWPHARFFSMATPLLTHFALQSDTEGRRKMYAYFQNGKLTLLALDKGKLLLLNTFGYKATDDCIYYLLYSWKQLEYDQQRDELHLIGQLPAQELLLHHLRKYIRQVSVIHPAAEFRRADYTKEASVPFDLQASLFCNL